MSQFSSPDLSAEQERARQLPNYVREWSLRPWGLGLLLLLPIVAFSVVLCWQAFRIARSVKKLESISISDLQLAVKQDPGNADLLHRLGTTYTSDPTESDATAAVKNLRQAVQLNPRRWDYWNDLGVACDQGGDTACSDAAFERATVISPHTPSILWALGNHYLLTDRPEKAFPVFRRLIALDPEYLELTMRLCFRATRDPQAIYTEVIPSGADPDARFAFLRFLCTAADYESAIKIWNQMIAGPDRTPPVSLVKPFLDFLIYHNQIDAAETVWSQLQHAGVIQPDPPPQAENILYNSKFELEPVNTGFDWVVSNSSDLEIDLADPSGRQGGKCQRFEFLLGRDADYDLVDQLVRVLPNTRYQLSAYVKSSNLTSDSGPRLRMAEVGCPSCAPRTSDQTVGTTHWHPIDLELVTQPQTRAVRVSFWRPRQPHFSRDITGTVWLEGITLRALPPPTRVANELRPR